MLLKLRYQLTKDEIEEALLDLNWRKEGVFRSINPVSYTHLDVYKRQALNIPFVTSIKDSEFSSFFVSSIKIKLRIPMIITTIEHTLIAADAPATSSLSLIHI